ncbi:Coenzyme PQQ synthesis protein E [uncultured archaeon]|nr:Coenzyme PQQ synthesis protein E [uncultured archaeon]
MAEIEKSRNLFSSYKLIKHLERLDDFEKDKIVYPIFVNINVSNKCNNNCPLCTTKNKDGELVPTQRLKDVLDELGALGVSSVGYGGGGDPTCHPDLEEILIHSNKNKMELAMTTNGYEMTPGVINAIIGFGTWIRVSLDADSPKIYRKTHGMDKNAFYDVVGNITRLVETKQRQNSKVVIGTTYLIGPQTIKGAYNAAKLCKEIGVDNIRFRPFFDFGKTKYKKEQAEFIVSELERCKELQSEDFLVSYPNYRCDSMVEKKPREYSKCYIHHLNPIITPDLKVYPCCFLIDKEEYVLGDLAKKSFKDIWSSDERKQAYERIDFKDCPNPCMLDEHIKLMWAVKNNVIPNGMNLIDMLRSVNGPINHSNFF